MNTPRRLREALPTPAHRLGLLALLLGLLAAPLMQRAYPHNRAQLYLSVPTSNGPFSFLEREIFDRRDDIDILFLGSSTSLAGIDAPYIEQALTDHLGRKTTVVSFGSNWRGEDLLYTQLRDVLARRKVRLLVFATPSLADDQDGPHSQRFRWAEPRDDADAPPLPLRARIQEYGLQVLGSPRRWLLYVRDERGTPPDSIDAHLGALRAQRGFGRLGQAVDPFVSARPDPPAFSADELLFGPGTGHRFPLAEMPLSAYQSHYLMRIGQLTASHQVHIAALHVTRYVERGSDVIDERADWRQYFGDHVSTIGATPRRLFAGLEPDMLRRLYYDDDHFNENGQTYFTRAIAPGILRAYDTAAGTR